MVSTICPSVQLSGCKAAFGSCLMLACHEYVQESWGYRDVLGCHDVEK
jgi:hypothetical protein